ncbi:MAG: hypothetical protein NT077_01730 [Candidatus Taylorbacteria bacterium]|nr:hypothetical protein [Candidatus Taylorbacteria bacterium]
MKTQSFVRFFLVAVAAISFTATASAEVKLLNMSCRGTVCKGENCFIGGFTVLEDGHQMLIRAVGPSLQMFGVVNCCTDPILTLYKGQEVIASNDDWAADAGIQSASKKMGAFALADDSKDAAILITLDAGSYTGVITSDDEIPGIALFEVYDLNSSPNGLYNLSVRGMVLPGEGAMIPGIVITGNGLASFLIRAVGPGLNQFGITNYLVDPQLTFSLTNDTNFTQHKNDDWQPTFSNYYFGRWGAFPLPLGSKDAALLFQSSYTGFSKGTAEYTTVVESADPNVGSSGVVLVEVYFVSRTF